MQRTAGDKAHPRGRLRSPEKSGALPKDADRCAGRQQDDRAAAERLGQPVAGIHPGPKAAARRAAANGAAVGVKLARHQRPGGEQQGNRQPSQRRGPAWHVRGAQLQHQRQDPAAGQQRHPQQRTGQGNEAAARKGPADQGHQGWKRGLHHPAAHPGRAAQRQKRAGRAQGRGQRPAAPGGGIAPEAAGYAQKRAVHQKVQDQHPFSIDHGLRPFPFVQCSICIREALSNGGGRLARKPEGDKGRPSPPERPAEKAASPAATSLTRPGVSPIIE